MSKGKVLLVSLLWLFLLGMVVFAYKIFYVPSQERAKAKAVADQKTKILTETGDSSRYDVQINFAVDSFSGYSVLRSKEFAEELGYKRIKLNLVDDQANYAERLKKLQSGEVQMAAFTVDALIKTCGTINDLPATIVAIIDETRGADAIVAYKSAFSNVDDLNNKDLKFVVTPDSPSETLARVVMANFNFTALDRQNPPFLKVKDAEEVWNLYRKAKPTDKTVFVLWEPYVSKILENPNTHKIIDSSNFKGYIVDVIVVNRNFLHSNKQFVQEFVKCYFKCNYNFRNKMIDLVLEDAKGQGTPVSPKLAEAMVAGIWWKNTQENYCHFGLKRGNVQHIEDIIVNITRVLTKTGGIAKDPTDGKPNLLYHSEILAEIEKSNFHPGIEDVKNDLAELPSLTEGQWKNLQPVGKLEIRQLVFARGTDSLTEESKQTLDELAETLKTFPQYYVIIKGNASTAGDIEANKALATSRAKAAEKYLLEKGVHKNRLRAIAVDPTGSTSVDFILGQQPY
jgi:ABC-type nitrate/sulfonate/bicarbonate transport system substrate-binding protein